MKIKSKISGPRPTTPKPGPSAPIAPPKARDEPKPTTSPPKAPEGVQGSSGTSDTPGSQEDRSCGDCGHSEGVAVAEVLAFPAGLLVDLPRGFALRCRSTDPGTHRPLAHALGDTLDEGTPRDPRGSRGEGLGSGNPGATGTPRVAPGAHGCEFVIVTSKARYVAAREARTPTLGSAEWRALASAAENNRAWWRQLAVWLERKRDAPAWKLSKVFAFDGMPHTNAEPTTWTVGEVFERLRVSLVAVEMDG